MTTVLHILSFLSGAVLGSALINKHWAAAAIAAVVCSSCVLVASL